MPFKKKNMKELLNAIKARLQDQITYIRSGDIYITPHENFIPSHVRFPCIGIKDGDISRSQGIGGSIEYTMDVSIIVYVQLTKNAEASVMGDIYTDTRGVLDISLDIHEAMYDVLLGVTGYEELCGMPGMESALSPYEAGSEMFGDEKDMLQRKILKYQYTKQRD